MSEKVDLSPAILDLVLYAGDGTELQINFIDGESKESIDVSYIEWAAQIRKTRRTEAFAELEIDASNADSGIVVVHISKDVSRTLPKSSQWDLQGVLEDNQDPFTILQGTVVCKPDVTREEVA